MKDAGIPSNGGVLLWRRLYCIHFLICIALPVSMFLFYSPYSKGSEFNWIGNMMFFGATGSVALLGIASICTIASMGYRSVLSRFALSIGSVLVFGLWYFFCLMTGTGVAFSRL